MTTRKVPQRRLGDRGAPTRAEICPSCDRAGFHRASCPAIVDPTGRYPPRPQQNPPPRIAVPEGGASNSKAHARESCDFPDDPECPAESKVDP